MSISLSSPLVSIHWLARHKDHKDVVVLDATIKKVTTTGTSSHDHLQIIGARFFDIKKVFSDPNTVVPNMLCSPEVFEQGCADLGITNQHTIIIYDRLGIYSSARVWWMFKTMGHDNVAVLDGGLPAWIDASLPTEARVENTITYPKGNFKAYYSSSLVSNLNEVQNAIDQKEVLVLDARSAGRFNKSSTPG